VRRLYVLFPPSSPFDSSFYLFFPPVTVFSLSSTISSLPLEYPRYPSPVLTLVGRRPLPSRFPLTSLFPASGDLFRRVISRVLPGFLILQNLFLSESFFSSLAPRPRHQKEPLRSSLSPPARTPSSFREK